MNSPLISVIVPIYNVEQYLSKCIDSILNQIYKNLEVILVDDGSSDNCGQICDDYAKIDCRIKVVHKENGGLSDARNAGIKVATGEYVCFVDSDDWISKEMISSLYTCMQEDKSDIVCSGVMWVTEGEEEIRNDTVNEKIILDEIDGLRELLYDRKLKQHVWNKLYRFDLIKDIPFEKGKYHEDVFWSYQVIARAKRISVVPESFYYYVQRAGSIMGESYSEKRLDALDANAERCKFISVNFPDLYNDALYIYMGSCMYHIQCALNMKNNKRVLENIKSRLFLRKTGNIFATLDFKQKIWMKMFFLFPKLTCKIRNKLGIGI